MDADSEYISIASGTFALAHIPSLCSISPRLYISRGNKTVFCTLLGCLSDRKFRTDGTTACCMFTFDKQQKSLSIQWDHTSQLVRLFGGYYWQSAALASCIQGVPTRLAVGLYDPKSLDRVAEFVKYSALFHLRLGHEVAARKNAQEKDKA